MPTAENSFILWLENFATQIALLEQEAKKEADAGNAKAYTAHMHQKAEKLAGLAKAAVPHLDALPPSLQEAVQKRLMRFSSSAAQALSLDSLFYMSALLFPENHNAGEPNDLESFIKQLRTQYQSQ